MTNDEIIDLAARIVSAGDDEGKLQALNPVQAQSFANQIARTNSENNFILPANLRKSRRKKLAIEVSGRKSSKDVDRQNALCRSAENRVRSECNEGIKAVASADDREGGHPHLAAFKGWSLVPCRVPNRPPRNAMSFDFSRRDLLRSVVLPGVVTLLQTSQAPAGPLHLREQPGTVSGLHTGARARRRNAARRGG